MKLSQRIAILRKIRRFIPIEQRILYYNAMIKQVMLYGSSIWSNCSVGNLTRILKLQKRVARVILGAETRSNSVNLFNKFGWLPFYGAVKEDLTGLGNEDLTWLANELNDFFTSVGSITAQKASDLSLHHGLNVNLDVPTPLHISTNVSLELFVLHQVTENQVEKVIRRLPYNKAPGMDNISSRILKDAL